MTLPDERYRAVLNTKQFLLELCDSKRTPRIPSRIRKRAYALIKHYPNIFDLEQAAHEAPHVFSARIEPLRRWLKSGQIEPSDG